MEARSVSLALLLVMASGASAVAEERADSAQHRPKQGGARVVSLKTVPLVISEPGTYVLDRSWVVQASPGLVVVVISASSVVFDLRDFGIRFDGDGTNVLVEGDNVTMRSGSLSGIGEGALLHSSGRATILERMDLAAVAGVRLEGVGSRMVDSRVANRFGISFGGGAIVERNEILCVYDCVALFGDRNTFTSNLVDAGEGVLIEVAGDRNFVGWNTLHMSGFEAVKIGGDHNVVRGNTITTDAGRL